MGIFNKLFKRDDRKVLDQYFKMIQGYRPVFTSWAGGIYEQSLVRTAIDVFASNCAKLKPEVRGDKLTNMGVLLQNKPNMVMDTYKFLYRLATILMVDNNALILPVLGERGELLGLFPSRAVGCEVVEINGEWYLRYTLRNGGKAAIEFERVGILNRFQFKDDLFGETNSPLSTVIDLMHAQDEGILQGIKNSAIVRFIAKTNNVYDPELLRRERDAWAKMNLSEENKSGLLITDNKFSDLIPVKADQWVVNAAQQRLINDAVCSYFGVSDKLLQSSYTDEEFSAYYSSRIEPFAIQTSLVLTNMLFTPDEIAAGSAVVLTPKRFDQMKNEIKLQISTQLFDRGIFSTNDVMDMYNLPHVEGGDRRYIRKEYTEISMLDEINQTGISQPKPKEDKNDH